MPVAQRVANAQLVKSIGVVDRDVGDHQVGDQQLLEHVGADITLLNELAGGAAGQSRLLHRWANQLLLDAVEVNAAFGTKRTDDEYVHHSTTFSPPAIP
jgi:hypothetical protein